MINIGIIDKILSGFDNNIGKASSEHEINTASIVPIVILSFLYKSADTTEKPHCGISPIVAPITGEYLLFLNY